MQCDWRFEKKTAARDKKLDGEMAQVTANSYLWQKCNSPRCCKTPKEAFNVFNGLNSISTKPLLVKEQILIQYLGQGWAKAYHPWSKNKYIFSPSELMDQFVKVVVLPLQDTEIVPDAPPMNLPGLPTLPTLGTVAHNITTLEEQNNNAGLQLRIKAMLEQERMEDDGIGNELMEMQKKTLACQTIVSKRFCNQLAVQVQGQ
jgi:hypothetical protein